MAQMAQLEVPGSASECLLSYHAALMDFKEYFYTGASRELFKHDHVRRGGGLFPSANLSFNSCRSTMTEELRVPDLDQTVLNIGILTGSESNSCPKSR